jgi:hypothetical protein
MHLPTSRTIALGAKAPRITSAGNAPGTTGFPAWLRRPDHTPDVRGQAALP